jgi:hypothetical protein
MIRIIKHFRCDDAPPASSNCCSSSVLLPCVFPSGRGLNQNPLRGGSREVEEGRFAIDADFHLQARSGAQPSRDHFVRAPPITRNNMGRRSYRLPGWTRVDVIR